MAELMPAGHDGVRLTATPNGVLTLSLEREENVVNPSMVDAISAALTVVEQRDHPKALVVTSSSAKFFSNGLDVKWMAGHPNEAFAMMEAFWKVLARMLTLDCHTVAAINGHAFGAGIFLALACDWRLMRSERGFICFPELNLGMRLSKAFAELAKAKLSAATLREGVLTGRRYGSLAALSAGLIDRECPVDQLQAEAERTAVEMLPESLKLMRFDPAALHAMKVELYTDAYRALTTATAQAEPTSRL